MSIPLCNPWRHVLNRRSQNRTLFHSPLHFLTFQIQYNMNLFWSNNLRLSRNDRLTELDQHKTSNPVMFGIMGLIDYHLGHLSFCPRLKQCTKNQEMPDLF